MRVTRVLTGLALALLVSIPAISAQPAQTVNFEYSAGPGNTVILQWNNPWAVSCNATGDWSGNKPASGSETLPAITSTVNYRLTCVGAKDDKARLSWTHPTQYTDGTALPPDAIEEYEVFRGTTPQNLERVEITESLEYIETDLSDGVHYFGVLVLATNGIRSAMSEIASKTITAAPTGEDVETIRVPNPPMPVGIE